MRRWLFWGWSFILLSAGNVCGQEGEDWRDVFDRPYLLVQKTTNIYSEELAFEDRREAGVLEPLAAAESEVRERRVYYRTEGGYLILADAVGQSALWQRNGVVVLLPEEGERVYAVVRELCRDRVFLRPAPGWEEVVQGEIVLAPYAEVQVRYVARDSVGHRERVFAYVESAEGTGWVFMNSLHCGPLGGRRVVEDGAGGQVGSGAAEDGPGEQVGSVGVGFEWMPAVGYYGGAVEEVSARERIGRIFEIYNRGVRAAKGYYEMMYGRSAPARTLAYTAAADEAGWRIVVKADEGSLALEAEKELYRTLRQVLGSGDGKVVIVLPGGESGF